LKKLDDYAAQREKAAFANPEIVDLEESAKALRARNFKKEMETCAKNDNYSHI
jgi:hypothetical protein